MQTDLDFESRQHMCTRIYTYCNSYALIGHIAPRIKHRKALSDVSERLLRCTFYCIQQLATDLAAALGLFLGVPSTVGGHGTGIIEFGNSRCV